MTIYYPKWDLTKGTSTINYDVSGYYFYLPAFFVYKDVKQLKWKDEIFKKYRPTSDFQQAYKHSSGNYVMKHSIGQAIAYFPFFLLGHQYASASEKHPVNGFSAPYQFAIFYGSLVIALIGLVFIRKVLLTYFDDLTTALTLVSLVLGTNWLIYSTFSGAMTHNYLFTLYALLIYITIKFYSNPSYTKAFLIGTLIGWAALIRPTEILTALVPLLWHPANTNASYFTSKLKFIKLNWPKVFVACVTTLLMGSIQLIYWKYATGDWIVYTYQDQGFNFKDPYFEEFLFSYKTGWLIYTPIMVFSFVGFYYLYKYQKSLLPVSLIFSLLFIYISAAWEIWDYGGSLGQRTMVQAYAILILPFAAFIKKLTRTTLILRSLIFAVLILFCIYNLWLSHQSSKGHVFKAGQMTKAYYWKTLFTFSENEKHLSLLDNPDLFESLPSNRKVIYQNDFETLADEKITEKNPITGQKSIVLNGKNQIFSIVIDAVINEPKEWMRVKADFRTTQPQRLTWAMSRMEVKFYSNGRETYRAFIRVSRFLKVEKIKSLELDIDLEAKEFDALEIIFNNGQNQHQLFIDNLSIETFDSNKKRES